MPYNLRTNQTLEAFNTGEWIILPGTSYLRRVVKFDSSTLQTIVLSAELLGTPESSTYYAMEVTSNASSFVTRYAAPNAGLVTTFNKDFVAKLDAIITYTLYSSTDQTEIDDIILNQVLPASSPTLNQEFSIDYNLAFYDEDYINGIQNSGAITENNGTTFVPVDIVEEEETPTEIITIVNTENKELIIDKLEEYVVKGSELKGVISSIRNMIESDEYLRELIDESNNLVVGIVPALTDLFNSINQSTTDIILTSNTDFETTTEQRTADLTSILNELVTETENFRNTSTSIIIKGIPVSKSANDRDIFPELQAGTQAAGITYDYANTTYQEFKSSGDPNINILEAVLGYPDGSLAIFLGDDVVETSNNLTTFYSSKTTELQSLTAGANELVEYITENQNG